MNTSADTQRGIYLVIAAMACFSGVDTVSKIIGAAVPVALAMAARFSFQTVVTGAVLLPTRGRSLFHTAHPWLQLLRGLLLLLSAGLAFLSLRYVPLSEFTAIMMLTPLIITLIAALSLGERVSWLRWTLVFGAFAGALLVIRPGAGAMSLPMLLPLSVVVVSVAFQLLTRTLALVDDAGTMHFYSGATGMLAAAAILPFVWQPLPDGQIWLLLLLLGVFGSLGHYFLILGYAHATPATLTPFLYGQIAFSTLAGWLAFSDTPDRWSIVGIVMIATCGIAATRLTARERIPPIDSE